MRLLLVEDDPMLGEAIRQGLQLENYTVDWVQQGRDAELAITHEPYALMLLDLGLPDKSGLEVLKGVRASHHAIPVLILTARDAVPDRVAGLDAGADDYLIKPFDLDELSARIRALLRRQAGRPEPLIVHENLVLNPATRQVEFNGQPLELSAREYALLAALLEKPGMVLSRAQLEQRIYGWGEDPASNAVEVHIHHLRKKLGAAAIRNIRGVGYMMGQLS
jgi:two-component system response regulator QseB